MCIVYSWTIDGFTLIPAISLKGRGENGRGVPCLYECLDDVAVIGRDNRIPA
ncbi:hypothetical protein ACFLXC_00825 [Chloroflexota bacterium]